MIFLIAESKSMSDSQRPVSRNEYLSRRPLLDDLATELVDNFRQRSQSEIIRDLHVSNAVACRVENFFHGFADKTTGATPFELFDGLAWQALSPSTLPAEALERASHSVLIVSSVYGLLRPTDIIKPYRFDFNTRTAPGNMTTFSFWRQHVMEQLYKIMAERNDYEILNFLQADAMKCLAPLDLEKKAKVAVIELKFQRGEILVNPPSNRIKEIKGMILRKILCDGIMDINGLKSLNTDDYRYVEEVRRKNRHLFVCRENPSYWSVQRRLHRERMLEKAADGIQP